MTIDRRRPAPQEDPPLAVVPKKLARFREGLVIDKDDLDECLIQQPELYYHVAEAHSLATAERDAIKLDLEIWEAEEGQKIRDRAAIDEEKLTEGGLKEQLLLIPRIQQLRRKKLEQEGEISNWLALKEAFQQRSFMLRELVPIVLQRYSGNMSGPRAAIADDIHLRLREDRARKRAAEGRVRE